MILSILYQGKNVYSPEELIDMFNGVKSVSGKFIDHRCPNRKMFRNFEAILKSHFAPIPAISDGGYTANYFFEFKHGVVTIRKSIDSPVVYVHNYVQGKTGVHTPSMDLIPTCIRSIESCLFDNMKTFEDAEVTDILIGKVNGLVRHPGMAMSSAQINSFWSKGFSIPASCLDYYPLRPTTFIESQATFTTDISVKRKQLDDSTSKLIKKYKPSVVLSSRNSITSYFAARYAINECL